MKQLKRLLVKMGIHGKAHKAADAKRITWMHNNGLGAQYVQLCWNDSGAVVGVLYRIGGTHK